MTNKYEDYTDADMKHFLKKQIDDRRARLLDGIKRHLRNTETYGDDALYELVDVLGDAVENGISFEDKGRYMTSQFDADIHDELPFIKKQVDVIEGLSELIMVI